jgi:hypothetical protein
MKKKVRLLALVPHRDARLPLREWSASLFAAGVPGAWSFPWVAPLALLKRPLSTEELKSLARALRQHINDKGGKFVIGPPIVSPLPVYLNGETASVLGPALSTELPGDFFSAIDEAVIRRTAPLVIGSALISMPHAPLMNDLPAPPQISFHAAALANMIYHETEDNFFEWKIGPPQSLPKKLGICTK